jgi:hypothetical protein
MNMIRCLRCDTDISGRASFYTLARNGYMFGFFCCRDCAEQSEHNRHLKAVALLIARPPETHRDLVVTPDIGTLKRYSEELEKRRLRKQYFS